LVSADEQVSVERVAVGYGGNSMGLPCASLWLYADSESASWYPSACATKLWLCRCDASACSGFSAFWNEKGG
jgi:hypothetical protein